VSDPADFDARQTDAGNCDTYRWIASRAIQEGMHPKTFILAAFQYAQDSLIRRWLLKSRGPNMCY